MTNLEKISAGNLEIFAIEATIDSSCTNWADGVCQYYILGKPVGSHKKHIYINDLYNDLFEISRWRGERISDDIFSLDKGEIFNGLTTSIYNGTVWMGIEHLQAFEIIPKLPNFSGERAYLISNNHRKNRIICKINSSIYDTTADEDYFEDVISSFFLNIGAALGVPSK